MSQGSLYQPTSLWIRILKAREERNWYLSKDLSEQAKQVGDRYVMKEIFCRISKMSSPHDHYDESTIVNGDYRHVMKRLRHHGGPYDQQMVDSLVRWVPPGACEFFAMASPTKFGYQNWNEPRVGCALLGCHVCIRYYSCDCTILPQGVWKVAQELICMLDSFHGPKEWISKTEYVTGHMLVVWPQFAQYIINWEQCLALYRKSLQNCREAATTIYLARERIPQRDIRQIIANLVWNTRWEEDWQRF